MKRRAVLERIEKTAKAQGIAWDLVREGANHTVFSLDGLMVPVPRHRELDEDLARAIFGECAAKLGKGWWR